MKTNNYTVRWFYLVLASVAMLLGGIIYSWSILKSPLAEEFGWNPTQLALNFTITICSFGIGGLVSGITSKKLPPRVRLIIAAILVFLGYLLASRVTAGGIGLLYFSYGILGGFGIGILYNVAVSTIGEWFPDRRGLTSGILMMCFGFSTLIFGGLAGSLIAMPGFGWRKTYLLLGVCMAAIVFVFGLFIKRPGPDFAIGKAPSDETKASPVSMVRDYTAFEMIRTSTSWKTFIALTLMSTIGNSAISFAKDFAVSTGSAETLAIAIVGILSVCNGFARICSGAIYDILPLRKTQYFIAFFMVLAPLVGLLAIVFSSKILGILALLLCGFSYGLNPTTSALYPKLFFGEKNYPLNFSIMNLTLIPTSFVATLSGIILTKTGSFLPVFAMLLAFAVIGSLSLLSVKPRD